MKILILEDDFTRVNWIREEFQGEPITIQWCTTVQDFITHLGIDVSCIVLDHDIPNLEGTELQMTQSFSNDINGQCGMDAAQHLAANQQWSHIPVLVWSWNPKGSVGMSQVLRSAGYRVLAMQCRKEFYNDISTFVRSAVYI